MGCWIVDRDARILRDGDHDQGEQREAKRHAQPHFGRDQHAGHGGELRRSGDQRERENDHDHGGLRQRGNHHLAAGADAAEAGADVKAGERQEKTRTPKKCDDRNEIGRPREQQPGTEGRHQRRRHPGGGEHEIGDDAKQPGRAFR